MAASGEISENSRRIARNSLLLYFRMFVLMGIGLFTSRIVLKNLGIDDYGIYNAVGGVVTLFTFLTTSMSSAVSRYLSHALGREDKEHLKRIFSTSLIILIALCVLIAILVEIVGMWLLNTKMNIPPDRMDAARIVLHCSLGVLVLGMLAVPYNSTIVAHEKMSAFAVISIMEGILKLTVAILLSVSAFDKLVTYAVLMLAVALIVRLCYGLYCRFNFEESRGKLVFDRGLTREMAGYAGWNFFGASAYVFNTQGVNIVVNMFFGVAVNAARGVATQVEGIFRQFSANILTAITPQITKSWAADNKEFSFELVRKGAKYTFWLLFILFLPLLIWTEPLLTLWLGKFPPYAETFTRLAIICVIIEMTGNTMLTLVQATGDVKKYYLITGLTSYLCVPAVWICFKAGLGPQWAYLCYLSITVIVFVMRMIIANRQTGFPIGRFLRSFFTITPGERALVSNKIKQWTGRKK